MTASAIASTFTSGPVARWLDLPRENPDFPVTPDELALEVDRMRATPALPQRPVLVLSGYHAPRMMVTRFARELHALTGGPIERFHAIGYPFATDIDAFARRVVREVDRVWPHSEPHRTVEMDVVGVSMGGLVARVAAQLPLENGQKRLRIARLFTLATPHNGALLAERIRIDRAARDMRPGSPFLERLNSGLPTAKYELTCYARLNDRWVGATRTAPPGREPIWVSGLKVFSHSTITTDPRLLADIALRLRNERPLSRRASKPPCD